jgi:hypothetical protein
MRANFRSLICTQRHRLLVLIYFVVLIGLLLLPGAQMAISASGTNAHAQAQRQAIQLPRPDHIVIVIEENKGFGDVYSIECPQNSGKPCAPYLISLASEGASLEQFFALHHPSQPNYIELFCGSNRGVIGDCCPLEKSQPQEICHTDCPPVLSPPVLQGQTLAGVLLEKNRSLPPNSKPFTFVGYAEDLPNEKTACCSSEPDEHYARKHCPWLDFLDVPATNPDGRPTTLQFDHEFWSHQNDVQRFSALPTISFVIPNLINDMHSLREHMSHKTLRESLSREKILGRLVSQGDLWLRKFLSDYVEYVMKEENNSLLIITWDEDSNPQHCEAPCPTSPPGNHIPTIFVGAKVKPGYRSSVQYTHYNLLRTILDMYDLPLIGKSKRVEPITDIWK